MEKHIKYLTMLVGGVLLFFLFWACGIESGHHGKPAGSIVGSWYNGDTSVPDDLVVLVFFDDGTFVFAQDGDTNSDSGGMDGIERGSYSWENDTGEFTSAAYLDTNGDWGLFPQVIVEIDGDKMTLTVSGEGTYRGHRIPNESDSIVGSWYGGSTSEPDQLVFMAFFEDGTFVFVQDGDRQIDPNGTDGMERGTYTWDADTGAFTADPAVDTNGEWGFSHPQGTTTVDIKGDSMTLFDSMGETYHATRMEP